MFILKTALVFKMLSNLEIFFGKIKKLNDKNNGCKDLRKASELGDEFSFDLLRENCN